MQDMKFRVRDEEHSAEIQRRLFERGCQWHDGSKVVKHTDMPCLYVEDDCVGFSSNDDGEYHFFNGEAMPEYVLTPQGTFLPASEYFVYPTTEYAKRFPCKGCRPGECAGCGEEAPKVEPMKIGSLSYIGDISEKTYAPLPILSRNEHERKRVAELLATITHANDTNEYVHREWLEEIVDLLDSIDTRRSEEF